MRRLTKVILAGGGGAALGLCYGMLVVPRHIINGLFMTAATPITIPTIYALVGAGVGGASMHLHIKKNTDSTKKEVEAEPVASEPETPNIPVAPGGFSDGSQTISDVIANERKKRWWNRN